MTCPFFVVSADAQDNSRHALIIANKAYADQVGRLFNTHKDADLLREALIAVGFPASNIEIVRDASRGQMYAAIEAHAERLAKAGDDAAGFLYYSGHGAARPGTNKNYLIPVSVTDTQSIGLWHDSISLDDVTDLLRQSAPEAAHIVIFDACRNELQIPQKGAKGFVPVQNWGGMLVAYSTWPGQTASDGDRNAASGPYAAALAQELKLARDLSASDLFARLATRVPGQQPWFGYGLSRSVTFSAVQAKPEQDRPPQPPLSAAAQDWAVVKDSESMPVLEAFRKQHGEGYPLYDALALERIQLLKKRLAALETPSTQEAKGDLAISSKPPLPSSEAAQTLLTYEDKAQRLVRSFTGHSDSVFSVAFSPDGLFVLSGSSDKTLKLWDVGTGKELRSFTGHRDAVVSVALSPDGRFALSGGDDRSLKLWEVGTGRKLRSFEGDLAHLGGHSGSVTSVAFSPDGLRALSGSFDHTLKLWEVVTSSEPHNFVGHSDYVTSVAFSPDGRFVLSGSYDKTLKLWDVSTAKELRSFAVSDVVSSVAFSPDGRFALSGSWDKTLKLWDVGTAKELRSFAGHPYYGATSVAFSPDGRFALSGSGDKTLKLWDVGTGTALRSFDGHSASVRSVAFSPDGRFALSGSWDKTLKLWDVSEWTAARSAQPAPLSQSTKPARQDNEPSGTVFKPIIKKD